MRISRLRISNYARIEDLDIEVRKHLVVIGRNNIGKTAMLRAINAVLVPSLGALYQQFSVADFRAPNEPVTIEVEFDELSLDEEAAFPDAIQIESDAKKLGVTLLISIDEEDFDSVKFSRRFSGKASGRPTKQQIEIIGWRYLSAVRSIGGEQLDGRSGGLRDLLANVDLGEDQKRFQEMVESFNSLLGVTEALVLLREELARHLTLTMPQAVDAESIVIESLIDPEQNLLSNLNVSLVRDGQRRQIGAQSDGTRSLMAMTFYDLASSVANIIAIDEPENHLHPSGQRALSDLLQAGKNQKIISTHSSSIVQKFDPEYVLAFAPDGTVRQLSIGALSTEEKLVAQWWITARLEPLTARYVLYVEGDSDRIFVETVASRFGVNLDKLGISIFDLGGAGEFSHAYKLFGPDGFDVGLAGLVDEDFEEAWAQAIGCDVPRLDEHNVVVCRRDLEFEYIAAVGIGRLVEVFGTSRLFSNNEVTSLSSAKDDMEIKKWFQKAGRKTKAAIALSAVLSKTEIWRITAARELLKAVTK